MALLWTATLLWTASIVSVSRIPIPDLSMATSTGEEPDTIRFAQPGSYSQEAHAGAMESSTPQ